MYRTLTYVSLIVILLHVLVSAQSQTPHSPNAQGVQGTTCTPDAGHACGNSSAQVRIQSPGQVVIPPVDSIPGQMSPAELSPDQILALREKQRAFDISHSPKAGFDSQEPNSEGLTRIEEPNPFQKFVQESTGQSLSMFGYNLFSRVPSTFAPVDLVPAPANYVVGPGDELQVRVWGQIDFEANVIVDRNGNIYLPKVGSLSVAGLKYDQLQGFLQTSVGRVFRNFALSVTLGQLRSIQVFVVGNAWRPGSYTISSLSTMVNALFASGGPSNTGSMRRIQLKRNGRVVTELDLYDLLLSGDKSKDTALLPGDVIFIPPVAALVAVSGSVNTPAIYELKTETSLSEVLRLAGGISTVADGDVITVERIDDHAKRTVDQFRLNEEGGKKLLKDGDLVQVLALSPKFDNAVTLRGHVTNPRRYPWHQGMRVRDLIPNRESLVPRSFWSRHNNSVTDWDVQTDSPLEGNGRDNRGDATASGSLNQGNERPSMETAQGERGNASPPKKRTHQISSFDEVNWEYAVIQRLNPVDLTVQLIPFHLGRCLEGDETQNLLLDPSDTITIFSKEDVHPSIAQQERLVRLEGEVAAAGWYRVKPGETLRQLVKRVGGVAPQAYLYAAEFTRESVREDQQQRLDDMVSDMQRESQHQTIAQASRVLSSEDAAVLKATSDSDRLLLEKMKRIKATGRIVLDLSPGAQSAEDLPDIVLENGDRFFVPYRLSSVNVMGEVYNSSSFIYQEGKPVGSYLHDAGGPSRYADKGRMFILRANGSVLPKQSRHSLWSKDFESEPLMPGDTIVVPEQLGKIGAAKMIKDWTQIFSQFALGVAAINLLK